MTRFCHYRIQTSLLLLWMASWILTTHCSRGLFLFFSISSLTSLCSWAKCHLVRASWEGEPCRLRQTPCQLNLILVTSARIALLQAISTFGKGTINSVAALDKGCYVVSMPPRCKGAAQIIALGGTAPSMLLICRSCREDSLYQLFEEWTWTCFKRHGQHLQLVWVKRELYHKKSCKFQHELSCHVYLVPLGMVAAGKLVGRPTAKTESSNTLNLETARYINSNCLMPIKATCCAQMEANLNSKASTSICWRCNLLGPHFSNRRAQSRTSSRRTRPTMDACPLNAFCPGQIKCRSVHLWTWAFLYGGRPFGDKFFDSILLRQSLFLNWQRGLFAGISACPCCPLFLRPQASPEPSGQDMAWKGLPGSRWIECCIMRQKLRQSQDVQL